METFPLVLPLDSTFNSYKGFISIHNQEFRFQITLDNNKQLKNAKIQCCKHLKLLLTDHLHVVQLRLQQCDDLDSFLVELKDLIERLLRKTTGTTKPEGGISVLSDSSKSSVYAAVIRDMQELGWSHISYIDNTLSKIHVSLHDAKNRIHTLRLSIPSDYPTTPPLCEIDLPVWENDEDSHSQKQIQPLQQNVPGSSLSSIASFYSSHLNLYQDFWDNMDYIDKSTWILEPENPKRADIDRRIAIGKNCSIQIKVNPNQPRVFPNIRFLGSDRVINPLKMVMKNKKWDDTLMLLDNLQNVLEMKFPSPQTTKQEEFKQECGICYNYRLVTVENETGIVPNKNCTDPKCGRAFHDTCLYEWFLSVPSSRKSMDVIFGVCPYCQTSMRIEEPKKA
eukprot:TRINITY_DN10335_c0_g1_i1.p1 TRINITY_DN10335_c0_g1~~TRINITY_DN10335_c0_g1_i1.p1  ORF type:complete len:393 (+),score=62.85 TRINITY_DN10335_c0_g1_i1:67-1245(+)